MQIWRIIGPALLTLISNIALAQSEYSVSDCSVSGLIVENIGHMRTTNFTSDIEILERKADQFSGSKELSNEYKVHTNMTIAHEKVMIDMGVFKNNSMIKRKRSFVSLNGIDNKIYFKSEIRFKDIMDIDLGKDESDILDIELRCAVISRSLFFW